MALNIYNFIMLYSCRKGWNALRYGICARYTCRNGTLPGYSEPLNRCEIFEHKEPCGAYMESMMTCMAS